MLEEKKFKVKKILKETHQVIGTFAAHISSNLRSRDSEVEMGGTWCKTAQNVPGRRQWVVLGVPVVPRN